MLFDFQQHTLIFVRLFASRSSKSPDSYHAIIPIYVDICPAIISVENTKASEEKPAQEFHLFICITLHGRKINLFCRVQW